ncbi:hypothetical protein HY639_01205 [Candidatus Woesearchaeota archaeon]|nr:hypothetical protein [Candidatus Woesearchaeota archaeon]
MSCGAFTLYGQLCGVDGGKPSYARSAECCQSTFADVYAHVSPYEATVQKDVAHQAEDCWKPVLYVQKETPILPARELGFTYHPTLDLALSYMASSKKETWEQERDQLEELIAREKKRCSTTTC